MRDDTLVASLIDSDSELILPGAWGYTSEIRREIAFRGFAGAHDEYVKTWRARLRSALRSSPMMGDYVR